MDTARLSCLALAALLALTGCSESSDDGTRGSPGDVVGMESAADAEASEDSVADYLDEVDAATAEASAEEATAEEASAEEADGEMPDRSPDPVAAPDIRTVEEPPTPVFGRALLGAPDTMEVGETYTVKLWVGEERRIADIEAAARSMGDATQTGSLELAPYICGILTAPGFAIVQPRRQCQEKGRSPEVSFSWDVSPQSLRELTLQAQAITYDRKGGNRIDQRDSETLRILVNASGFTRFNLWATEMTESVGGLRTLLLAVLALLGVISAIVWRVRNMGKKPETGAAEGPSES